MCNDALLSLSLFLKDWELARVALSCHMALDMLCQEMREACGCHMSLVRILSHSEHCVP